MPTLPKSRQETHERLNGYEVISSQGENMLQTNDAETGIIIFATTSNLALLCEDDVSVYGDGTFKVCPKFFHQVYTIHAFKNGIYVPCVFCILPSKSAGVYVTMFREIQALCFLHGLSLNIDRIHLDFEKAVHQAAKEVWPQIVIKGCLFHLRQAWWRKIVNVRLRDDYKDSASLTSTWLKRFFGLCYLSPEDVPDAFAFDIMSDAPDDARTTEYADYILSTYVNEDATFPPQLWADSENFTERTTNACEAFHKHFADQFYHPHPSVFELAAKLRNVQTFNYAKKKKKGIYANEEAKLKRKRRLHLEQMKASRSEYYETGVITRLEYVTKMSFRNLPSV
jgi:hypothetical protein